MSGQQAPKPGDPCPLCSGTGLSSTRRFHCWQCYGTGKVQEKRYYWTVEDKPGAPASTVEVPEPTPQTEPPCPRCKGTGVSESRTRHCSTCLGAGVVRPDKSGWQ